MAKRLISTSIIIFSIFCFLGHPFAATDSAKKTNYHWRLQSTHNASDPSTLVYMTRLSENLKEFSNGRINLEVYPAGALVPFAETLNMLGNGVYEMAFGVGAYWQGKIPVAALEFGVPFIWESSSEVMTLFYDKGIIEILRDAYAEKKVRYLNALPAGPMSLETTEKPDNLEELKNMKIRAFGTMLSWYRKLGVPAVQVAWPEVYTALKLGTIDGCTVADLYWYQAKFPEITKFIMPVYSPYIEATYMNMKLWESLPEDIKQIVDYSLMEAGNYYTRYLEEALRKMRNSWGEEYGVETFKFSSEDQQKMKSAALEVLNEMSEKDKYCGKFVEIVQKYNKEMGSK